ncbi:SDR family NAD(P)-dependent oxidoreductase [Lysinibacillus sp. Bpr_S20]|uniref:SDR family NAD(P)-dependent oxidoreductase n=1 Tax=Lysinibacillus sp. Bpr_S20 TaxID=2933964 RepID=UPI0020134EAB|nr:SDR family NAD(P)-dependent oxidoreductase [Lysinibacillus sp. Bpr_S20]MCL1702979.1 SDR family oxidoreductase [Lysinibacillus sp. Bpr_S20]
MNSKRALVTGGSRGIGRVIVKQLIEEGYFVNFTFLNSEKEAKSLETEHPNRCQGDKVNGCSPYEVNEYLKTICDENNPITVLINNAGITRDSLVKDSDWVDFKETLDTNLGGCFNFCRSILPYMIKARKGDIINISSLASDNVRIGNAFYGTSKIAINRFSENLALEMARFNIAVNVIAPGFVETDLIKDHLDLKTRKELLKQIPIRRFTKSEEIAEAVILLLSRKPLLIGATLPVGGGGHLS